MIAEFTNVITTILMAFGIAVAALKKDYSIALILTVIFLVTLFFFL